MADLRERRIASVSRHDAVPADRTPSAGVGWHQPVELVYRLQDHPATTCQSTTYVARNRPGFGRKARWCRPARKPGVRLSDAQGSKGPQLRFVGLRPTEMLLQGGRLVVGQQVGQVLHESRHRRFAPMPVIGGQLLERFAKGQVVGLPKTDQVGAGPLEGVEVRTGPQAGAGGVECRRGGLRLLTPPVLFHAFPPTQIAVSPTSDGRFDLVGFTGVPFCPVRWRNRHRSRLFRKTAVLPHFFTVANAPRNQHPNYKIRFLS